MINKKELVSNYKSSDFKGIVIKCDVEKCNRGAVAVNQNVNICRVHLDLLKLIEEKFGESDAMIDESVVIDEVHYY